MFATSVLISYPNGLCSCNVDNARFNSNYLFIFMDSF